ncbi:hypothetical protein GGG16DRAFT_106933 [Schizophyllum commune]
MALFSGVLSRQEGAKQGLENQPGLLLTEDTLGKLDMQRRDVRGGSRTWRGNGKFILLGLPLPRSLRIARCTLGVVVDLAGHENANLTSIVPRSAPVPFGDRCDIGPRWGRGEEWRSAPLQLSACASEREILANRHQMRRGPRPAFSLTAATVERAMGAARSAAEGAETVRAIFCALSKAKKYEIGGKCAKGFLEPFQDRKICKSASNGPRSAPKVPVDVRECQGRGGGGASCLPHLASGGSPTLFFELKRCPRPASLRCNATPLCELRNGFPFPSPSVYIHDYATLFEPPAPLATPSILVSTYFNISRRLGADITFSSAERGDVLLVGPYRPPLSLPPNRG